MLSVNRISKTFGVDTILKDISFNLSPGERLALVGPNGSGKTTLLRILTGEEQAGSGSARFDPPALRVGYLSQGFSFQPEETLGGFIARMEGDLPSLSTEIEQLAAALAHNPDQLELQAAYDQALGRMQAAAENSGRGPAVLAGLGLGHLPQDMPVAHLSGGQKTRLALAGVLLSEPQLLLLDEPTNHLDLDMLAWLEGWLTNPPRASSRGILLVSHDRAFLDGVATGILELDPSTHTLRQYAGNYTAYLEAKMGEREKQWQAFSDQQEEIDRLRHAITRVRDNARFKRGGKGDSGDKFAKGFFANRTLATIRRAKQLEHRLERLMTEEKVDKPGQTWQMKLEFGKTPPSGKDVLACSDLAVGYEGVPLLSGINLHVRHGQRVALVGANGAGKTTLLRTIAGLLPPVSGALRLGANVRPGYMAQEQEELDPSIDSLTAIRRIAPLSETDARTFLHLFLFGGDDVFTPVGKLSYGERARLSLASLAARGCNLLLLDEPLNHLDIPSRARFEQALASFEGTVLAVVHDRYFIEGFANEVWEAAGDTVRVI